MKNAVSQLGNLQTGELRLGAGPYPAARLIPRAVGRMALRYPRVRVNLQISNWLDLRSSLLGSESLLEQQIDPYVFVRGLYLQRRQNLVYDGNPPPEDDFDDDEDAGDGKSG